MFEVAGAPSSAADPLEAALLGLADLPDDDAPELVFDLDTPEPFAAGYLGPLGQTRSRPARVRSGDALLSVEVYVAINADTDPELGRRARGELSAPLHALSLAGEPLELAVPFLYHEPSLALFAVVLPPALRHRELEERIELYRQLQLEPASVSIPQYVLEAPVVVGAAGLRALRDRLAPSVRPPAARFPAPVATPVSPPPVATASSQPAQSAAPRRSFGPANAQALHTIHGIPPGAQSGPSLTAIPAPIPSGLSDSADATAATVSLIVPADTHPGDGPGDGSVDRPLDDGDAGEGADADARERLAAPGPGERPGRTLAPPPAGTPLHSAGTSLGTINRPIEVASDAFALRVGESSGPVTAANEALDALLDAPTERPGGFLRPPTAERSGDLPLELFVDFPLDPPIIPAPAIAGAVAPAPAASPSPGASPPFRFTAAVERGFDAELPAPDVSATPDTIDEDLSAGLSRAVRELPPDADPLTTEARDQPVYEPDEWLAQVIAAGACDLTIEHGRARVALAATAVGDAEVLRGPLDVRVVLSRAAAYPVVVLLVGSPAGLRGDRRDQIAAMCLDVSAERDRAVLTQLAKSFEVLLEVFAGGRWIRRVLLSAPLADNAAYVLRAADDYLAQLTALGGELSAGRACEQVAHPGHDITGAHHPDAEAFCDKQLGAVATAAQLRNALTMAQRFARPEGEDYLVCVRGFPLVRWRRLRRHVLDQAVTWGIWMGAELARVAVSEGLARSRRDLVHRLYDGFALLRAHPTACDLDEAALEENAEALVAEARALGVTPGKARTLFDSQMDSVVAGTIDQVPSGPIVPLHEQTLGELVRALDTAEDRLAAALEICRRRASSGAAPLVAAVARMSRTEAVQVLAAAGRLGSEAEAPLITALTSSKAYVRQGAALALGLLRGDDGVAAIVEQLFAEPTEIWREVARAIGQVGPQALHHLARVVREQGAGPLLEERAAWALAHLGARDCHKAVLQMSGGHSVMAPIAAQALALVELAARDQQALVSDADLPETTMNRTFSRQFFAALDEGLRGEAMAPREHGSQVIALDEGQRGARRALSDHDLPD